MADFLGEIITLIVAEDVMPGETITLIVAEDVMPGEQIRLCESG